MKVKDLIEILNIMHKDRGNLDLETFASSRHIFANLDTVEVVETDNTDSSPPILKIRITSSR